MPDCCAGGLSFALAQQQAQQAQRAGLPYAPRGNGAGPLPGEYMARPPPPPLPPHPAFLQGHGLLGSMPNRAMPGSIGSAGAPLMSLPGIGQQVRQGHDLACDMWRVDMRPIL